MDSILDLNRCWNDTLLTRWQSLSVPFCFLIVGYGSWFEHVLEFWEHRMDSNVLFLKYEDMYKVSSRQWQAVH